jgi:hypothetical protein
MVTAAARIPAMRAAMPWTLVLAARVASAADLAADLA